MKDALEIEVLSFSKPDMMLADLSTTNRVVHNTPANVRVQAKYAPPTHAHKHTHTHTHTNTRARTLTGNLHTEQS